MITKKISIVNCKPGMILSKDIVHNGIKLASKDTIINSYIINGLINFGERTVNIYILKEEKLIDKNEDKFKIFIDSYEKNIYLIKEIVEELAKDNRINIRKVLRIVKSLTTYLNKTDIVIKFLTTLKRSDEYTYFHCINVAIYSMLIGNWMNLSEKEIWEVIQGGLLHDIGKIKVDHDILNKPYKLTNDEFYEMKKHTIFGYDIINEYEKFSENIKNSILMHHERVDGSGYPFGMKGHEICLYAKIIGVADTFDAMISNRVYKKGVNPFKIFEMFLTEGIKKYDTSVIFALLNNINSYYIGMKVILEDGSIGEIIYIPPNDIISPIIKVNNSFMDFSKNPLGIIDILRK